MTKQINIDLKLYPWLKDCLALIEKNPDKIHVIKSKRLTGKSVMAELLALKAVLEHNKGNCFYVLPSFKQCVKVFNELTSAIENCYFVKKINNGLFTIDFINGSTILMFSAELKLSSLQGFTCKTMLIIDEVAFISDEVINNILPWTNTNNPTIIMVSTPLYKAGAFWDFWCDGLDPNNEDVLAFDFCNYDTSALLTKSKLEYYRKRLPAVTFRLHYLGEFAEDSGSVFGEFGDCLTNEPVTDYSDIVFGIDWCSNLGLDETAIAIINGNKEVIEILHFNDKEAVTTISLIIQLALKYRPRKIIAEKNSIGNIYLELLRRSLKESGLDIPVTAFNTSNESKHEIVSNLQVLIQNKEIKLPNDDALKLLLMKYEMELSATNKPVYNSSPGFHDDMLMALMIGLSGLMRKKKTTFI